MENQAIIYTDGASLGNPGPGAYATLIIHSNKQIILSHSYRKTTNNRMELRAIVEALKFCYNNHISNATIYTDSQLIYKAIHEQWIEKWIRNCWKTANKKPVLNQDLWIKLHYLLKLISTTLIWVEGHSGNDFNDLVDRIARTNAKNSSVYEIDCFYEFSVSKSNKFLNLD